MEKCAYCGDYRLDHFEGKGVCDLGFCWKKCSEFVPSA